MRSTPRATGFSLIEVMVATLIMGGLFVAALSAVGAARAGQTITTRQAEGHLLARELMMEILAQPYAEGDTFGREAGESDFAGRVAFDDVDDYAGLREDPPRRRQGDAIDADGYTRAVDVRWASPSDPMQTAATDTGLKRIRVTVRREGRAVAELVALRSDARPYAEDRIELPQR